MWPQPHPCQWVTQRAPLSSPGVLHFSDSCPAFFCPDLLSNFLIGLANGRCRPPCFRPSTTPSVCGCAAPITARPAQRAPTPTSPSNEPPCHHAEAVPRLLPCSPNPRAPSSLTLTQRQQRGSFTAKRCGRGSARGSGSSKLWYLHTHRCSHTLPPTPS